MLKTKRNRGFTLVEILVAFGMLSLIISVTATVILASMNSFSRTAAMDYAQQLGLSVYSLYEQRLKAAPAVQIGGQPPQGQARLSVEGGHIYADGQAYFPDEYYGGMTVEVNTGGDGAVLALEVLVLRPDGSRAFAKQSSVRLITLHRLGGQIGGQTAPCQNPVIYYTRQETSP